MVYLQFPTNLTEEELMLQAAYIKLKKKKKALQDLKTRNPEAEQSNRSTNARDAREMAMKLIKSGAISAIKTPKRPEESFKRPRGFERKLNSTEKTVSSYQPFSASQPAVVEPAAKKLKLKNLYESFVASTDPADKIVEKPVDTPKTKLPAKENKTPGKGNTIFVYGSKLSDDFLREHFAAFGNIIQIILEGEKKGFVTFEKSESAEQAIIQMNGMKVASIDLKVSFARRQFAFNPLVGKSASSMWVSVAATYGRNRGLHRDKRDLQTYDDNLFE